MDMLDIIRSPYWLVMIISIEWGSHFLILDELPESDGRLNPVGRIHPFFLGGP